MTTVFYLYSAQNMLVKHLPCLNISLLNSWVGSLALSILQGPVVVLCGPLQNTRPWQKRLA